MSSINQFPISVPLPTSSKMLGVQLFLSNSDIQSLKQKTQELLDILQTKPTLRIENSSFYESFSEDLDLENLSKKETVEKSSMKDLSDYDGELRMIQEIDFKSHNMQILQKLTHEKQFNYKLDITDVEIFLPK